VVLQSYHTFCSILYVVLQVAFEVMGVIAVITNCSLVPLLSSVKQSTHGYSDIQVTLFFVATEVCAVPIYTVPQKNVQYYAHSKQVLACI